MEPGNNSAGSSFPLFTLCLVLKAGLSFYDTFHDTLTLHILVQI